MTANRLLMLLLVVPCLVCASRLAVAQQDGGTGSGGSTNNPQATCKGKFPNPINDICWRCMLPISIGSSPIANTGSQRDIGNPSSPICICPGWPPRVGISLGFWEPVKMLEVPRRQWCFPLLGGLQVNGPKKPNHGRGLRPTTSTNAVFYQVHDYTFPILYALGVSNGHPCLIQSPIDLGYVTELDPSWNDPSMSAIFNAEAVLFSNPIAIAACAADCAAATVNFPLQPLFWCAGCQGSGYPQQGFVPHHNGGVDTSLLLSQRLLAKLHKFGLASAYHSESVALCAPTTMPIIDRRAYKTQMLYPIPNTRTVLGKCCQTLGETSITWRSAKEFPIGGEDFGYLFFRKRNCCLTYY
jgi:conjugal transfer pilus assembly protein TraU